MSLVNTRLQAFRAQSPLDKWETRASTYGALDVFKSQTDDPNGIISPELKGKANASEGSQLQIPVLDGDDVTISQTIQPLVVTDMVINSQLVTVSFVDYYWSFLIHPAKHKNNEISMQREFNNKTQRGLLKLMATLDSAGMASLELGKTQVINGGLGGRYALTGNTVIAPQAEKMAVVGDISVLQEENDFYGPFDMVANGSMKSHVRNNLLERGEFNEVDKTYQYADKNWHFSNRLANGANQVAAAFAVQQGSVGMLQKFSADCQMGHSTHKHNWGIEMMPIINMPMGVYSYDDAVDATSLGAHTARLGATKVEAYGFHTAIAFINSYNSDPAAKASPIMKVAIADA